MFFIPIRPTAQQLRNDEHKRRRANDPRSAAAEKLFQQKVDACKWGFSPMENLQWYTMVIMLCLMMGYGAGVVTRAIAKKANPEKYKTTNVWVPNLWLGVPYATLITWSAASAYASLKKKGFNVHEEPALREDLAKADRLTKEEKLTMGAFKYIDPQYARKLIKLDNRYINGILAADYVTEEMGPYEFNVIKEFITAHLIEYPGDYQKIVDGLTGKHIEFTPAFFESLRAAANDRKNAIVDVDEYLEHKKRVMNRAEAIKIACVKKKFGIKSK